MIKEICPKGHYYDAEKYPQCPHCQKEKEAEDRQREQTEEQNLKHSEQKVSVVNEIATENRKEKIEDRGFLGWIRKNGKNIQQSEEPKTQKMNKEEKKSQESEKKSLQSLVNEVNREDKLRTIGMWGTSIEPVVGWLVCITGKSIGEAYRLKAGKNYVGRDIRMDVVISNDAKVSREKHMTIMYEPEA